MTVALLPGLTEAFLLTFARIGALIMLLPGLGERAIPARQRLAVALAITLMLLPGQAQSVQGGGPILLRLAQELAVGLMLGTAARMVTAAAESAGSFAAQNIGLSFAQTVDPSQGQQAEVLAGFMRMLAALVVLNADLHHLAIVGIHASYRTFPPGSVLPVDDALELVVMVVRDVFAAAIRFSAPCLAFGLVFNLGMGLAGRMAPQIQLFFLVMPASVLIGLLVFGGALAAFALQFRDFASSALTRLFALD